MSVVNVPLNFMVKMAYFVMDLTTIKEKLFKYLMKKNTALDFSFAKATNNLRRVTTVVLSVVKMWRKMFTVKAFKVWRWGCL